MFPKVASDSKTRAVTDGSFGINPEVTIFLSELRHFKYL